MLAVNPAGIPAALIALRQWVVWRLEERHGKQTKVPYCPATGEHASTTDPTTWTVFEAAEVCARTQGYDGVGFVFTADDPYAGIDLDGCIDPETGEIAPWAAEYLELLPTYTERSVRGLGLHLIVEGTLPGPGRKKGAVEMYSERRYFVITGEQIAGEPGEIARIGLPLKLAYEHAFPPDPPPPPAPPRRPPPLNGTYPADAAVVEKVIREPAYANLWAGRWEGQYKSQSEADLALCGRIAFFTGPDPAAIDRIFKSSRLDREKWDDHQYGSAGSTYGADTIARALAGKSAFYDWDRRSPKNGAKEAKQAPENADDSEDDDPSVVTVVGRKTKKAPQMPHELEPEAYHGLPGRVMRTIAPHTESHPAGILGSFLTCGGCLIGPGPHVFRDGQRHGCNEFGLLVGGAGTGRKGTSTRRVEEIFKYSGGSDSTEFADVDAYARERNTPPLSLSSLSWTDMVLRGLGSGEALVAALAEALEDDGDVRRVVLETEFARCLKVMQREGSTLSDMLKAAWDTEPLHVRTKARLLKADRSHVSILAHITEHDLRARLAQVDLFNGFGNRFLWFATRRVQSLPFGGGTVTLAPIVSAVHHALRRARFVSAMEFDAAAASIWDEGKIYERLSTARPGLLGALTDRAAAHVTRLSLQYAVWDGATEIGVVHLLAGLAVWDYSERTCAAIFGRSTGDTYADTIREKLLEVHPGYMTRKEIRDLFARNAAPGRIPAALELLETLDVIDRGKHETGGHPEEIIVLKKLTTYDQYDLSPLEAAREQAKERGFTTDTTDTTEARSAG